MSTGRIVQHENPTYKLITTSKVYSDANSIRGEEWYDYTNWNFPFSSPEQYEIAEWIGAGKYSDVFVGYRSSDEEDEDEDIVALKVMKPVRPSKYNREAKILMNLRGGDNIIELHEIVQNPHTYQFTFVFEFVQNTEYSEFIRTITPEEAKFYLYNVMKALNYAHSHGVMHRDVKPQNIMYDRKKKLLRLIDWGLADFYHPKTKYNIHVASIHFKAIELLVDYQYYDYSVDMWSFGVTMASIIFNKTPFFKGVSDYDMVSKIVSVLGSDSFDKYVSKYGIELPPDLQVPKCYPKKWTSFINKKNEKLATTQAIDLISKCLRYDHTERITSEEALNHPYFDDVRDKLDSISA